jgi:branched-chain amino acid transport system ATP-binding protein
MLKVENLEVNYGHVRAIKGISFEVHDGEIVTLIGANGAGKSTTLRAIMGILKPAAGRIELSDAGPIHHLSAHKVARMGIAMVAEGREILFKMTVEENMRMGAFTRNDSNVNADMERLFGRFPLLGERRHQLGGTLSGGEQQMLAIARALMSRPKLLLMDEPSLGLAPKIISEVFQIIQEINQDGTTILLVEQNARKALQVAQRGYVLETGIISLADTCANLMKSEKVVQAYLGG